MEWVEIFVVFVVSHFVGDYLLQTDWQATHKRGGLGPDPVARRALLLHVMNYTIAFVPALVWLGDDIGVGAAIATGAGIAIPHLIQDDGRLLTLYMRRVKGCGSTALQGVFTATDQSFHFLTLFLLALLVGVE